MLGAGAGSAESEGEEQEEEEEVEEMEGEERKLRDDVGGGGRSLTPMALERHVWFVLYEAARLSTKHRTAILLQCL